MAQKIECQFYWRRDYRGNSQAIAAIVRAVSAGYRTRDELVAVLPQFAVRRIALALDALFTADMLEYNFGVLSVHPDMLLLIEMVKNDPPLRFPIIAELSTLLEAIEILNPHDPAVAEPAERGRAAAKINGWCRAIFAKLGCTNAAGAQLLVNIHFQKVDVNA